jgi:hypothetical protein
MPSCSRVFQGFKRDFALTHGFIRDDNLSLPYIFVVHERVPDLRVRHAEVR